MKKFHELTNSQKEEAVSALMDEVRTLICEGFLDVGTKTPDEKTVRDWAEAGAEVAFYAEKEDKVLYEIA